MPYLSPERALCHKSESSRGLRTLFGPSVEVPLIFLQSSRTLSETSSGSSCSHTCMAVQPRSFSLESFRRSLSWFSTTFASQNCAFDFGLTRCSGQPCQKHPSTKMAKRIAANTISGRPGRSRRCNLNRRPFRCKARRKSSSGPVSLRLSPAMNRRTVSLEAGGRLLFMLAIW